MRVIVIIPASRRGSGNRAAKRYDRVGGERTFTIGLSKTGAAPATHYWMSGVVDRAAKAVLDGVAGVIGAHIELWDIAADPGRPDALLRARGLKRIEE